MTISPLALAAKKTIEAAWLHGAAYDLASQAAFALESAQQLQSPETVAELEGLRARVAELEAEAERLRQLPDLDIDKLAQALLLIETGPALSWAHTMSDHDLNGFLDDLLSAASGRWQHSPEVPNRVTLAEIEKACARWKTPGEGSRLDGSEFDGVTVQIAPTLSLEDPHDSPLHHRYTTSRDLPELGGAPC